MKSRSVSKLNVKLGNGWRQFAFTQPDLDFIGVVRRGMEIGALAQDKSGVFWQVNGDMRQMLNTSRMNALLKRAKREPERGSIAKQPTKEQRAAVSVTVKPKRRTIVRD